MDLLQGLSSLMGGGSSQGGQAGAGGLDSLLGGLLGGGGKPGAAGPAGGGLDSLLGGLMSPGALGGLAGALMGGGSKQPTPPPPPAARTQAPAPAPSSSGGLLGGLLGSLMGGSAPTPGLDPHIDRLNKDAGYGRQQAAPAAASSADRVTRMLRAMIFAARADGHIDQNEQNMITSQLQKYNVGQEGMQLVQKMIAEPLNPASISAGVQDGREALQLYGLSCAVCGKADPSERRYLDALSAALRLPPDMKADIESKLGV